MTYNELSVYGRLRKIEYVAIEPLQDSFTAYHVKLVNSGSTECVSIIGSPARQLTLSKSPFA